MNTIRWCLAACALALGAAATAEDKKEAKKFPDAVERALKRAREVELVALDGESTEKGNWHGWKVTKQAKTTKGEDSEKVTAAVMKGVAEGDAGAKCFNPRHGIRVKEDKTTYDLVICFECHWVYVYTDGDDKPLKYVTTAAAEKVLNDFLSKEK